MCGKPWRDEVGSLTESDGGLVKGESPYSRPKIQGIAVGAAREAVIDLLGEMDREGAAGSRATAGDGAWTTKLWASPPCRLKADQVQYLAHGNLPPKLVIVDARHDGLGG